MAQFVPPEYRDTPLFFSSIVRQGSGMWASNPDGSCREWYVRPTSAVLEYMARSHLPRGGRYA